MGGRTGSRGPAFLAERIGFGVFLLAKKAEDFGENSLCGRVVPVLAEAGPEGVFVELEPFGIDAAKNHGAEAPVPNRKSLGPQLGGLLVPEGEVVDGRRSGGKDGGAEEVAAR